MNRSVTVKKFAVFMILFFLITRLIHFRLLQLIFSVTFNQAVKIHSLKIKAPADKGPKHVRIFINQPRTLDFDLADSYTSIQDLE